MQKKLPKGAGQFWENKQFDIFAGLGLRCFELSCFVCA